MPPRTGAKLRLGGKVRTLRYTVSALTRIQDELNGEALQDTMAKVGALSFRHITAMVWGGLLHEESTLSLDEAGELIEPPVQSVIESVMEALTPWITVEEEASDASEQAPASPKKKGSRGSGA